MLPASSPTRSPGSTPSPANAPAVRSTRWSSSWNEMDRPWNSRASLAGKSSAASRTRSATFMGSSHLHVLSRDRPGGGSARPLGVRGPSGLEQRHLLVAARPPLEQDQPAGGDLRVVAETGGSVGVAILRPDQGLGGGLEPPGQPELAIAEVQAPHAQAELS